MVLLSVGFKRGLSILKQSALYSVSEDDSLEQLFHSIASGALDCGDGWLLPVPLVELPVKAHVSEVCIFSLN